MPNLQDYDDEVLIFDTIENSRIALIDRSSSLASGINLIHHKNAEILYVMVFLNDGLGGTHSV